MENQALPKHHSEGGREAIGEDGAASMQNARRKAGVAGWDDSKVRQRLSPACWSAATVGCRTFTFERAFRLS